MLPVNDALIDLNLHSEAVGRVSDHALLLFSFKAKAIEEEEASSPSVAKLMMHHGGPNQRSPVTAALVGQLAAHSIPMNMHV